jgi:hypothetical protein
MDDMLPLEAYERPFVGPIRRTVLVMAALWGIPMTLLIVHSTYQSLGVTLPLVIGVLAGLLFGVLWTRSFRRRMRKFLRRLHEADPALVPPPPAGVFHCRVGCSFVPDRRIAVGGHLYAGPGAWVFVPHRKNLPRHRAPIILPISADLTLTPHTTPQRGIARLLTTAPVQSLEVCSGGSSVRLLVPEPEVVAARLAECAGGDATSADAV